MEYNIILMMFCGKQRGLHLEKVACLPLVLEINFVCKHVALFISIKAVSLHIAFTRGVFSTGKDQSLRQAQTFTKTKQANKCYA